MKISMIFEVYKNGVILYSFDEEFDKGVDVMMKSIADYMVVKGKNPWTEASKIYKDLVRGITCHIGDRSYVIKGMRVAEFGKVHGLSTDECVALAKRQYNKNYINNHFDELIVSRYMLLMDKPFHVVDVLYNNAYEKDNDIGGIYDWLYKAATIDELKANI